MRGTTHSNKLIGYFDTAEAVARAAATTLRQCTTSHYNVRCAITCNRAQKPLLQLYSMFKLENNPGQSNSFQIRDTYRNKLKHVPPQNTKKNITEKY